jgi:hypothetical protein
MTGMVSAQATFAISLSNSARPLVPGMRTSSSRQQGSRGTKPWPVQFTLEGFGAVKHLAGQVARAQQPGQGVAHAGIVIHDENGRVLGGLHGKAGGLTDRIQAGFRRIRPAA